MTPKSEYTFFSIETLTASAVREYTKPAKIERGKYFHDLWKPLLDLCTCYVVLHHTSRYIIYYGRAI